jgi:hypothetical protein
MKQLICIFFLFAFITSCKKEVKTLDPSDYLKNVRTQLKDSLTADDYAQLDFGKAVLNKVDSVQLYFLRIPFKDKAFANDFLIVKTNGNGIITKGKIVHIDGKVNEYGEGIIKRGKFDGSISISSLDRKDLVSSRIDHGFITAFHPVNAREAVYGTDELPEVVIVAYVQSFQTVYSTWLYLTSLFYDSYGGGTGANGYGIYYGSMGGGGGGGSTADSGGGAGYADVATLVTIDQTMLVDVDTYANKAPINIDQYLKCFDNIPDAGAQCGITIYADIPVDSDPNKLFDFSTGSPGHTFIQIKKTNGSQGVVQNLGFYPLEGWKTISDLPISSKFVDDGQHEFNASYSKVLTPDQLRSVIQEIRNKETAQYDLDDFNCTDWALDIFNNQGNTLTIPKYLIPGSIKPEGVNTPQGLYNKLNELKSESVTDADKISIGFMKGWVSNSNGPCN